MEPPCCPPPTPAPCRASDDCRLWKSWRVESRLKRGSPHHPSSPLSPRHGMVGGGEDTLRCCCGLWPEGACGMWGDSLLFLRVGLGVTHEHFPACPVPPHSPCPQRGHLPPSFSLGSEAFPFVSRQPGQVFSLIFCFPIKRHPCAMELSKTLSSAVLLSCRAHLCTLMSAV